MTIFGHHTVNELIDLTKNWDNVVNQLLEQSIAAQSKWQTNDPSGWRDWKSDWDTFYARWNKARDHANITIGLNQLARDYTPAEDDYNAILTALTKTPGQYQKGDFQDLSNRLSAIQTTTYTVIQPTAADVDLSVYKAADTATKQIESGAKSAAGLAGIGLGLVGLYLVGGFVVVGIGAYLGKKLMY